MADVSTVLRWQRVYCVCFAVFYLLLIAAGIVAAVMAPSLASAESPELEWRIMGLLLCGLGVVFAGVFAAGLFLPHKSWAWIYHLVLICLGFGSCCSLPFSIALLIQWIKPEIKAHFGM